ISAPAAIQRRRSPAPKLGSTTVRPWKVAERGAPCSCQVVRSAGSVRWLAGSIAAGGGGGGPAVGGGADETTRSRHPLSTSGAQGSMVGVGVRIVQSVEQLLRHSPTSSSATEIWRTPTSSYRDTRALNWGARSQCEM